MVGVKDTGYEGVEEVHLALKRVKWRSTVGSMKVGGCACIPRKVHGFQSKASILGNSYELLH
jgi:hypothetical protein